MIDGMDAGYLELGWGWAHVCWVLDGMALVWFDAVDREFLQRMTAPGLLFLSVGLWTKVRPRLGGMG